MSNDLLEYAKSQGFHELHFKFDKSTNLCAIIALHSIKAGPALGGCRFITYPSIAAGLEDVLRLAKGMSYKNAMANLPLGGGKAVILRPEVLPDRKLFFQSMGRFVNQLGGQFIIAMDSGVVIEDMDAIALETPFVATLSKSEGNPAPSTARGVLRGIEAAVQFKFNQSNLKGLRIAIQGVGHVGALLAEHLAKAGAELTICDSQINQLNQYAQQWKAKVVSAEKIYDVDCDIFAPCALGGILNDITIPRLKAKIVAGAANNQLGLPRHAQLLKEREILYAPDYVINAGGVIHAYAEYMQTLNTAVVNQQIDTIYTTLLGLFKRAQQENKSPHDIADIIVQAKIF